MSSLADIALYAALKPENIKITEDKDIIKLLPNKTYEINNPVDSLSIEFYEDGGYIYQLIFTTNPQAIINLPENVVWASVEPVFSNTATFFIQFIKLKDKYVGMWVNV